MFREATPSSLCIYFFQKKMKKIPWVVLILLGMLVAALMVILMLLLLRSGTYSPYVVATGNSKGGLSASTSLASSCYNLSERSVNPLPRSINVSSAPIKIWNRAPCKKRVSPYSIPDSDQSSFSYQPVPPALQACSPDGDCRDFKVRDGSADQYWFATRDTEYHKYRLAEYTFNNVSGIDGGITQQQWPEGISNPSPQSWWRGGGIF